MLVTIDTIFVPIDGIEGINIDQIFTIEVSQFDSVRQIKQKIQELKGIPISTQSLLLDDGSILFNDLNLHGSQIVEGSIIYLFLDDPPTTTTGISDADQPGQQTDTVAVERLQTPLQTPAATTIHSTGGVEGQSMNKRAREDIAESGGTSSSTGSRELTFYDMSRARNVRPAVRPAAVLTVMVVHREKQTAVVVSAEEEVSVLRGKLQQIGWRLPARCKFVSNHRVMNTNRSFAYNRVRQGDMIQVR